jgi:hypothetical protein
MFVWPQASLRIFLTGVVLLSVSMTAVAQSQRSPERFDGLLAIGRTYTADFVFVEKTDWQLSEPVKILPHHAVHIEWIDKKGILPSLLKENRYQLEFKVVAKNVRRAGNSNRWNTTYRCAIKEAFILIPPKAPDF